MANDFFSWIGDGVRSAGDFLFGADGLDLSFKDVLDAGSAAIGGGSKGSAQRRANNTAQANALMARAMQDDKYKTDAMKTSSKSEATLVDGSTPIFKDKSSGDPWMSSFRRLVEGTKTI